MIVAYSGQVTAATTNIIADNMVTMTLAFLLLALVTLPIEDLQLFSVNLGFVTLLGAAYAAPIYFGSQKYSFQPWELGVFIGMYLVCLAVMVFGVLNVI